MALFPAIRKNGEDTTEACDVENSDLCVGNGCAFESDPAPADSSSNVLCDGFNMMADCDTFGWHIHVGESTCLSGDVLCDDDHEVIINGDDLSTRVFVNGKRAAVSGMEMWCHYIEVCGEVATEVYKTTTTGGSPNVFIDI